MISAGRPAKTVNVAHIRRPRHSGAPCRNNDVLVSESNAHLATALSGLGIVHTTDFMVRPFIEKGQLVPILVDWRPDPHAVYIAYPPSRRYSTKVRVFVDWVTTIASAI